MSNTVFDFLVESFLFDDDFINENYRTIDEKELQKELIKYKEYVISKTDNIISEINCDNNLINVSIESFDYLPNEVLLKQLALYLDKVIINDPIYACYQIKRNSDKAFSSFIGVELSETVNRNKLAISAKYMKNTTSLVVNQFVKYCPISNIHETPEEIPILYSKTNFADSLPKEIMEFFHSRAQVRNIIRENGKMIIEYKKPFEIGTTINVSFDESGNRGSMAYQYALSKTVNVDEESRRFTQISIIPDNISDDQFNNWVFHSINRAALKQYKDIVNELILSKKLNCMYLAKTQYTADLLTIGIKKSNVKQDLANLALELNLPIFNKISLNQIISIRNDYGEAFHNFREELNRKLLDLRPIDDEVKLKTRLESISYEMNEMQIAEVNKEVKKIRKKLAIDTSILTGSLLTSFCTNGLTLVGAAGAVINGINDYTKYLSEVRENNGFFLWKLNQHAKK